MMGPGETIALVAVVVGGGWVLSPLFRALARRIEGMPAGRAAVRDGESEDRLRRIEHAVEAMAVEVERISEGQRFVTRLLAERGTAGALPAPGAGRSDAAPPSGRTT